jgi:hypothetical protein
MLHDHVNQYHSETSYKDTRYFSALKYNRLSFETSSTLAMLKCLISPEALKPDHPAKALMQTLPIMWRSRSKFQEYLSSL